MKRLWLLLLPVAAFADDPWANVKMKEVAGVEGRVKATVPDSWRPQPVSGNIILRVIATHGGGHDLMVVRENGQDDPDKQRDRYVQYDSGKHPGAEVKKYNTPFYGYRLDAPGENRVVLRAFVTDGTDGLVVSLSSRLKMYDQVWAAKMMAVLGSLQVDAPAGGAKPEDEGAERRVWDDKARVSLVVPAAWKKRTAA